MNPSFGGGYYNPEGVMVAGGEPPSMGMGGNMVMGGESISIGDNYVGGGGVHVADNSYQGNESISIGDNVVSGGGGVHVADNNYQGNEAISIGDNMAYGGGGGAAMFSARSGGDEEPAEEEAE